MVDAKLLRGDFERVAAALERRCADFGLEAFEGLDMRRRGILAVSEDLKNRQNVVSKQVPEMRKRGEDVAVVFAEMKELSDKIKGYDVELREVEAELEAFLLGLPNLPSVNTPDGSSSDDNVEVRRHLEPTVFDFAPKPHWELGRELGILDSEAAGAVTGARFHFYKGAGARLERALINFMLDLHIDEHGYVEILPPQLVHRRSMIGTGQLPKFEEDAFKIADTEYFLTPTAEVPVTNIHRESILDGKDLPISYCAYSACFRAEAGSAGRDTRGLIRQHQFNKVELVKFATPENSYSELERLTAHAEEVLKRLGLPYRVVRLCAGDLGFASAMTYDIEVYMPSYENYVEISSCSNFEDFQARRANIRYKESAAEKARFVHTLNGSGLALGRCTAAILENFQNVDGSITVPAVLRPYMGGIEIITSTSSRDKK